MRINLFFLACVLFVLVAGLSSVFGHQGATLKLLTWGYYFLTAGVVANIIRQ